jgi:hypothetical protein
VLHSGNTVNVDVAITVQSATELVRDVAKFNGQAYRVHPRAKTNDGARESKRWREKDAGGFSKAGRRVAAQ